MKALPAANVRMPKDISVAGFDDLPVLLLIDPFLMVASQPVYEMGREAVNLLIQRLAGSERLEPRELECPAYDPWGMQAQGLLYATSNRGGCHMRGNMVGVEALGLPKLIDRFQVQGKSGFVLLRQNTSAAIDSLVPCKFTNMGVAEESFARVLSSVIGIQYATGDLIRMGERVYNLEWL